MKKREAWRDLCAQFHPDDGTDPNRDKKRDDRDKVDRKTRQLCAQVRRAVGLTLLADCADQRLQQLQVEAVTPGPDATRLRVTLSLPASDPADFAQVTGRLEQVKGMIRAEVGAAISRKRVPELVFCLVPREEVADETP